jgi:hypothetical protein
MAITAITTKVAPAPAPPVTVGFAGFLCEVTEQPVSVQDCLACAQNGAPGCPMTPALVERIAEGVRPLHFSKNFATRSGADFGISVTELIGCPRRFRLVREHAYFEKPTSMARTQRGTARHADLALYSGPGLKELRISWSFTYSHPEGQKVRVILTGQPDLLSLRSDGWLITDYKDTENPPRPTYTYTCHLHPEEIAGKPHWRGRGPFTCSHCGTLTRAQVDEYITPPAARTTHALQIHLLALLVTKNGALLASEYNQTRKLHCSWNTPAAVEDTPVAAGEIAYLGLLRCSVVPDTAAALAHLKRRLAALLSKNLPPILSDPVELWECGYCPVRDACEQLHGGPVGRDQIVDGEA